MSKFSYVIADVLTGTIKDEIPFSNVRFSSELSTAGGFSGTVHTKPDTIQALTNAIVPSRITESNLDLCRTAVWVLADGSPVWGGILYAFDADLSRRQVTFAGQDFWSYWKRRYITATQTFSSIDQITIANNLITYGKSLRTFPGTYVGNPTTSGVLRSNTYNWYELKTIGEAIEAMANLDNGFDFGIDYSGSVGSGLNFQVTWSYPTRGRRTGLVFDANKDVTLMRWTKDGTKIANRVIAVGNGSGDNMLALVTSDTSLLSSYPVYETAIQHKDVTDRNLLADKNRQDLKYYKKPVESIELQVLANSPDVGLGTFIVGDTVTVLASSGFVNINNLYRIIGYTVSITPDGLGIVTIRLKGLEATS